MKHWTPRERLAAVALAVVVFADIGRIGAARREGQETSCLANPLPPRTSLTVDVQMLTPLLRPGRTARGVATVTNTTSRPVLVSNVRGVLTPPEADRALTPAVETDDRPRLVPPAEYVQLPFVVRIEACRARDEAAMTPGFIEVVVVLDIRGADGVQHTQRSAARAATLAPQ